MCARGQLARTPDFPRDITYGGRGFLRGKLKRNCPTREPVCSAKREARCKITHLNHHAVNEEIQRFARFFRFFNARINGVDAVECFQKRARGQAVFLEKRDHFRLLRKRFSFYVSNIVKIAVEPAPRRHARIQVPKCARRRIARIFELFFPRSVQRFKDA